MYGEAVGLKTAAELVLENTMMDVRLPPIHLRQNKQGLMLHSKLGLDPLRILSQSERSIATSPVSFHPVLAPIQPRKFFPYAI